MKAAYWIGTMAALTVLAADACAQSPKLRQRMASEETQLVKDAGHTNQVCGTAMKVTFDWAAVPESDLSKYSPQGYCNAALEGIQQVCGDPSGKDAVREKIKRVTCGFGASREIALKNGVLSYKINFRSSNDTAFVYEYLENEL
jgi:hypothetical protein